MLPRNHNCPGFIDTDMIGRLFDDPDARAAVVRDQEPIGRMGRPEEIAAAVLWLCAEEAAFTIGHALGWMAAKLCEPKGAASRR